MKTKHKLALAGVNICRLAIAGTFTFSGIVKLIDPKGFAYKIEDYITALGLGGLVPESIAIVMAAALSSLELWLGVNILFAMRRRLSLSIIGFFLVATTAVVAGVALSGKVVDCGCFGDAVPLTTAQTILKNILLLLCTAVCTKWWRLMPRFIPEREQWLLSITTIACSLCLALYCAYRLPVVDFRPYRVGTDLPRAMEEELSTGDVQYADFMIETEEEGDITQKWLTQPGPKMLLIAPRLEDADDGSIDQINDIYDLCRERHIPMLCLTSSTGQSIERWQDLTGAEYPFAWTDALVLRTMIRSNPGLMLLDGGTVTGKWPHTALPTMEDISNLITQKESTKL